jgi:ElaB protein
MDSAHKLNDLFDQTEELLGKLADQRGPEIQELREKLHRSMGQTRVALKSAPARQRVKVRDVAASFNDYVRNYPWMALATGVLVASSIGILATRATRRSLHLNRG